MLAPQEGGTDVARVRIHGHAAEQHHADEQRHGARDTKSNKRINRSKPGSAPSERSRSKKHAERKATHALEPDREGRPSRESSRKSANRAKPDTNFNLREELQKGSPETRFRKADAGAGRVRGKSRGKNAGA
jgi:hypothetical protein